MRHLVLSQLRYVAILGIVVGIALGFARLLGLFAVGFYLPMICALAAFLVALRVYRDLARIWRSRTREQLGWTGLNLGLKIPQWTWLVAVSLNLLLAAFSAWLSRPDLFLGESAVRLDESDASFFFRVAGFFSVLLPVAYAEPPDAA